MRTAERTHHPAQVGRKRADRIRGSGRITAASRPRQHQKKEAQHATPGRSRCWAEKNPSGKEVKPEGQREKKDTYNHTTANAMRMRKPRRYRTTSGYGGGDLRDSPRDADVLAGGAIRPVIDPPGVFYYNKHYLAGNGYTISATNFIELMQFRRFQGGSGLRPGVASSRESIAHSRGAGLKRTWRILFRDMCSTTKVP